MKSRYIEKNELTELKKITSQNEKLARDFLPLAVSLATGLRVGDVIKIRLCDLGVGGFSFTAEKTGKDGFADCPEYLIQAMISNSDGVNWCFPSPVKKGRHITRQAVWKRAKRFARLADINPLGFSPHSMRKNFAVEVFHSKGMTAAQTALQHSRLDTTQIYILSDFVSGDNASTPLYRKDIDILFKILSDFVVSELKKITKT